MDSTTALIEALRFEEHEDERFNALVEFEENVDDFDFEPPGRDTLQ